MTGQVNDLEKNSEECARLYAEQLKIVTCAVCEKRHRLGEPHACQITTGQGAAYAGPTIVPRVDALPAGVGDAQTRALWEEIKELKSDRDLLRIQVMAEYGRRKEVEAERDECKRFLQEFVKAYEADLAALRKLHADMEKGFQAKLDEVSAKAAILEGRLNEARAENVNLTSQVSSLQESVRRMGAGLPCKEIHRHLTVGSEVLDE